MKYAHIVGWGHYLPERILTNDGMASIVDTSNEWIYTRTGIRSGALPISRRRRR